MHYHLKKLRWKAKGSRIAKGILEKKKKKVENRLPCDLDSGVRKISVSRNKNGPPLLLLLPGWPVASQPLNICFILIQSQMCGVWG